MALNVDVQQNASSLCQSCPLHRLQGVQSPGCCHMQVLATGRSRSTTRRSCMRRATDSDMHPVSSSSQHPISSRVLAAMGQPSPVSATTPQASQYSSNDTQQLGAAKVQRSLTWTEEGQAGVRWGTEGQPGGNPKEVTRGLERHSSSNPERVIRGSEGGTGGDLERAISGSNGPDSIYAGVTNTTTQTQHQQQQQQHSLVGVNVLVSTTIEEATSSQTSPSVQPSRHGAVLHRQRLTGSAAAGMHESDSGSSNSGQTLVPARFRAGTLALFCDAN